MAKTFKLSILTPTLPSRLDYIKNLMININYQSQFGSVQWLYLGDNKSKTVGEKRNLLLDMADGEWVCFVDDDDKIHDHFVEDILNVIKTAPDKSVITFWGTQSTNGHKDAPFRYGRHFGRNFKKEIDGIRWKVMLPDHLCVWRKEIIKERFPLKNLAEDHDWARAMVNHYDDNDQFEIQKYLYHYEYNKDVSECRK